MSFLKSLKSLAINVSETLFAVLSHKLGELVDGVVVKQIGILRTYYTDATGNPQMCTTEAIIRDDNTGLLYAVERYRGLAFVCLIEDDEMIATINAELMKGLEEGEGFIYTQTIRCEYENIYPYRVFDDGIAPNCGVDGVESDS